MIKVWGRTNSSNVMKVLWLLDELGLTYERIDAGGKFGRTDAPEYRAMNPLGLVPTIEDDAYSLFESNAILRYLCNRHAPDSPFYPAESGTRGTVEAWMEFQQTALNAPQGTVFISLVRTAPEKRDQAKLAAAIEEAGRMWTVLDSRLADRPYLVGETLTLADITFGPHLNRWFAMPVEGRPETPNLRAYYERLLPRPAYKQHCAVTPT